MHDASIEELCRIQPTTLPALRRVCGFGERKTEAYGPQILMALKKLGEGGRAVSPPAKKSQPAQETRELIAKAHTLAEIATIRAGQLGCAVVLTPSLIPNRKLHLHYT